MPDWVPVSAVPALGVPADDAGEYTLADAAAAAAPSYSRPGHLPYAAPAGTLGYGTYAYDVQVVYAGFWLRFVAAIVDGLVTAVPGFIAAFALEMASPTNPATGPTPQQAGLELLLNLVSIVITWLYHAMFESSAYQATPGKMLLGIRVTDMNGQRIGFGRATGRHFAKILSGIICMIGYIMAAFTERKQALHDIIAGALVVRKQS